MNYYMHTFRYFYPEVLHIKWVKWFPVQDYKHMIDIR